MILADENPSDYVMNWPKPLRWFLALYGVGETIYALYAIGLMMLSYPNTDAFHANYFVELNWAGSMTKLLCVTLATVFTTKIVLEAALSTYGYRLMRDGYMDDATRPFWPQTLLNLRGDVQVALASILMAAILPGLVLWMTS